MNTRSYTLLLTQITVGLLLTVGFSACTEAGTAETTPATTEKNAETTSATEKDTAPAQGAKASAPEKAKWLKDFAEAKTVAQQRDLPILLDFTGSDWCPPCMRLNENVFSTDTFLEWAADNVVLVKVDFPRRIKQSQEQKSHNEALAKAYNIKGFPTIYLVDAEGKPIAKTGFRPEKAPAYIDHLESLLKGSSS